MYPHVGCRVLVHEQTVEGRGRRLRHRAVAVGTRHLASLILGSVVVARTCLFTLRWLKCQCCCC